MKPYIRRSIMKIKIDESKTLEFKIDTSSGCALEDLEGFLRFSFGGVEYGFPAKIEEGNFKVEIPPFKNVINNKLTESISKNKELIVKGRLDVIANKTTIVTPWSGDIDIEIPVSMKISEGDEILKKEEVTVSDPDKKSVIEAFNEAFNPPVEDAVKTSKFKDALDIEIEVKEEEETEAKDPTDEVIEEKEEEEEEAPVISTKSRFAKSLEKAYVKEA